MEPVTNIESQDAWLITYEGELSDQQRFGSRANGRAYKVQHNLFCLPLKLTLHHTHTFCCSQRTGP